ncbi:MAG: V-type ATP synthase subunit D [Candidatus Micrarchaeaceae archaeon]
MAPQTHDIAVTRLELTRLKAKKRIAEKGLSLLKSKRGALISEFFKQIIKLQAIKANVAHEASKAIESLKIAEIRAGRTALELNAIRQQKMKVNIKVNNIMGIVVPDIEGIYSSINSYEYAFMPASILDAKNSYAILFKLLIEVAEKESSMRKLLYEIETLNKRANTIENVIIPKIDAYAKYIEQRLDDRDRETIVVLKFIKENLTVQDKS